MIRSVVFDYGGTLVREKKRWDEVRQAADRKVFRTLKESGLTMPYEKFEQQDIDVFEKYRAVEAAEGRDTPDRLKYEELVDQLFGELPAPVKRDLARKATDAFWTEGRKNFAVRRDAKKTLLKLNDMGMKLGMISNHHNEEALLDHLSDLKIDGYFDTIIASCSVGWRKPDPRIFKLCLRRMGVEPREAVFVGDLLDYDVLGSKRVGMTSILIPDRVTSYRNKESSVRPDFTVSKLSEIPGIISKLNRRRGS